MSYDEAMIISQDESGSSTIGSRVPAPLLRRDIREKLERALYSKINWTLSQWLDRLARPESYCAASKPSQKFSEAGALFVHIPKNAGMSIKRGLFPGQDIGGHYRIRDFMMIFPEHEFKNLFKFCFVRNPWDRVYSAYTFLLNGGINRKDKLWRDQHLNGVQNFEDFVLNFLPRPPIRHSLHFKDQLWWITDPSGECKVDMLARFENIFKDYRKIATRMGVEVELKAFNRSKREKSDYRQAYTPAAVEQVAQLYVQDIAFLEYSFAEDAYR